MRLHIAPPTDSRAQPRRRQPTQLHTASPMTSSRSQPFCQDSSSVNTVTDCRQEQGIRVMSVPQNIPSGPNASKPRCSAHGVWGRRVLFPEMNLAIDDQHLAYPFDPTIFARLEYAHCQKIRLDSAEPVPRPPLAGPTPPQELQPRGSNVRLPHLRGWRRRAPVWADLPRRPPRRCGNRTLLPRCR